jgi:CspA family cold shock protein
MWQKIKTLITGKESQEKTGRIKFFNRRRGYGFIESDNLEKDVFVHVTDLKDRVSKGDQVTFYVEPSPKGLEAKNVRLA